MLRKTTYSIAIALILLTPFMYSDELYNGIISAKQIWFYGAMALLMLVTALDLLFDRKPFTFQFNKIDLALLAFYTYYTIRAATTPYMPLLYNQRWINWSLCVVLYFIIRRISKIWTVDNHSWSFCSHLWSLGHSLFKRTTNDVQPMSTNDASQMTINDSTANDELCSNDSRRLNDAPLTTFHYY
jgi:hypothetical protein